MSQLPKKYHGPEVKCGSPDCPERLSLESTEPSLWRDRAKVALAKAKEGEHAWFKFKDDSFDSCAKCGIIRRADDKNNPCAGPVKISLRQE